MMKKMTINSFIFFIISFLLSFVMLSCASETGQENVQMQNKRLVKLIEIKDFSSTKTRAFPAIARATREVKLAFRVSGPLVSLLVNIGDYVEKGELIAQIDRRDYEVRLRTAEAALETCRAKMQIAQLQYNRHKNLLKTEAVSKARYDAVKADFDMISAQVDAAYQDVRAARNALNDTRLEAPFSGFVNTKFVENHDNVQAMQSVVSFLDCSLIEVTAGIPEEMLSKGVRLKNFECEFETYPGLRFEAVLKELGTKPMLSNQAYPLTVILNSEDSSKIKPGMAATIYVTFSSENDSPVFIPAEAVVSDFDKRSYIWIYNPETERVNKRYVETGKITSEGIEVKNSLKPGGWVVSAGAHFLLEDEQVKPIFPGEEMF